MRVDSFRRALARAALLLSVSLGVGTPPAHAQPPQRPDAASVPSAPAASAATPASAPAAERGAELSVYLVTMGQGDAVWEKFGHNALWVHDPARGTDHVYNWGIFDFDSPGYWSRFVKGDWLYMMGVETVEQLLWQYQMRNRTVTVQELNLTPAQKAELQAFVEWNALPQNREYLYDYYRDNCSTRVRDVLDRVLGGRLQAATADSVTPTTYRWHSERLIADDQASYVGLLAGLGPAADRPITAWEEMFLPEKVQQQVRRLQVPDERGRLVPLVAREQVVFPAFGRAPEREAPPFWLPYFLAAGLAIGGLFVLLGRWAERARAGRVVFSALAALWALLAGTGGVLLLGLWLLTNHRIAYQNENLFQLHPLLLVLALLVPALAFGARWAARPARFFALLAAGIATLGLLVQVLPGLDQVNGSFIALTLPIHWGLAVAVARLAGDPVRLRPLAALLRGAEPAETPPARPRAQRAARAGR